MATEEHRKATTGAQGPRSLPDVIPKIALEIARLEPGPAAALRRGPLVGAGAAAYWRLLAWYNPVGGVRNESGWAALIQAIAILTPKGRDPAKPPAHDYSRSMGQALHDAGLSDLRLARLLSATPGLRPELTVRTCRRLAGSEFGRFNLVTLGQFVLFGDERAARRIARDYYRADFASMRTSHDKETPTDA